MQIKNSVFLVTGGASDPYGRATVEALLKDGARVIICDLPTKDLHIYGDEKAIFLPIDASQEEDMKTLISVIQDKYGKLDGIVNCIDHYKEIDVTKKEPPSMREFAEIVHENVLGPFNIARFLIPLLSRNIPKKNGGRGIIINMSSAAAFEGPKGGCAYAASKAAVIRMTEALSLDLQGVQIKCLSIITNYKVDDAKTINGLGGCFELKGTNGEVVDAIGDEPRRFAQLVKKVIESSAINDATLRLEKIKRTGSTTTSSQDHRFSHSFGGNEGSGRRWQSCIGSGRSWKSSVRSSDSR